MNAWHLLQILKDARDEGLYVEQSRIVEELGLDAEYVRRVDVLQPFRDALKRQSVTIATNTEPFSVGMYVQWSPTGERFHEMPTNARIAAVDPTSGTITIEWDES